MIMMDDAVSERTGLTGMSPREMSLHGSSVTTTLRKEKCTSARPIAPVMLNHQRPPPGLALAFGYACLGYAPSQVIHSSVAV
jgi:hypothetical protein